MDHLFPSLSSQLDDDTTTTHRHNPLMMLENDEAFVSMQNEGGALLELNGMSQLQKSGFRGSYLGNSLSTRAQSNQMILNSVALRRIKLTPHQFMTWAVEDHVTDHSPSPPERQVFRVSSPKAAHLHREEEEEETEIAWVPPLVPTSHSPPPWDDDSPPDSPASMASSTTSTVLGRGAYARVDIRLGPSGSQFAEKRMSVLGEDKAATASRELLFADRYISSIPVSPHDNTESYTAPMGVVEIFAVFTLTSEHSLHIIMEYMDGGDAATAIAGPATDIRVIAAVARQMLEGLRFIHGSMRALHRDIKPENVLVSTTGRVALSDFGCSAVTTHDDDAVQFSDQVGTILYMSPERLLGDVHGVECDVWSLGVTVAALATGKHPFVDTSSIRGSNERMWALAEVLHYTSDSVEEYRAATEAAVAKTLLPRDNADLTDFVHCCTWRRSDIASLLEHPFVRGMNLDDAVEHVRKHLSQTNAPLF